MKPGQNPAHNLTDGVLGIMDCGDHCEESDQQEEIAKKEVSKAVTELQVAKEKLMETKKDEHEVELTAQGVSDLFKLCDRDVILKVVDIIKEVDMCQIKKILTMVSNMVETTPNGDVYFNVRVKVKDGD